MAYSRFRQLHPEFESLGVPHRPAFHDPDGVPVYEGPWQTLLAQVVRQNDVASLHLYNDSPHTKVFWDAYEVWYYHPFVVAAQSGSFDALQALLEIYLADPTLPEPLETYLARIPFSPINEACAVANRELTLWLLHHDPPLATLHDWDACGETPLFSAARVLRLKSDNFHGAIATRHKKRDQGARTEDFICFLLDQGCSVRGSNIYVDQSGRKQPLDQPPAELYDTVLGAAIPHASYQMVSRLIAEGADVYARQMWWNPCGGIEDGEQVTALHIASHYWNLEGMQALVDHRGELSLAEMVSMTDGAGRLPLHWALTGDRDDRTEMDGKDNQEEITAQMMRTVELLLEANPDTVNVRDQQSATVFHYAVTSNSGLASVPPVVKLLLNANPLPVILNDRASGRNFRDATPLEAAMDYHARRGGKPNTQFKDLLDILLRNGADGRACNDKGQNLLHRLAMSFGDTDCAEVAILDRLLEFINVNDADADGRTPLHFIVRHLNRINAVRHLISRGANVKAADEKGNTPLHEAMYGKMIQGLAGIAEFEAMASDRLVRAREEMIQVLVEAGASMDHPNAAGKTPPQLLDEVTEMIKGKGAEAFRRATRGRYSGPGRGQGRGD